MNYVNIVPDIRSAYKAVILLKSEFKLTSHSNYVRNYVGI
jgi:hypothetical protein